MPTAGDQAFTADEETLPNFLDLEPVKLVIGHGEFAHRFGGSSAYAGLVPSGQKHPVDLLFELDLRDPLLEGLASWFPRLTRLPLLAGLHYNFAELQYRVPRDDAIQIDQLGFWGREKIEYTPDHPYWPPGSLSLTPLKLEPISEVSAFWSGVAISADAGGDYNSDLESLYRAHLKPNGYPWTQIGGRQKLMQGSQPWTCGPGCPVHALVQGETDRPWFKLSSLGYSNPVFAVCWEAPIPGIGLFDEDEAESLGFAQMIWSLCPFCRTIHSCNRCD
jgi:hypothetical protein